MNADPDLDGSAAAEAWFATPVLLVMKQAPELAFAQTVDIANDIANELHRAHAGLTPAQAVEAYLLLAAR